MPFDAEKPPVDKVKGLDKLSEKLQRQWVHVWNSCYDKIKAETNGRPDDEDEAVCYKQAWRVVRREQDKRRRRVAAALALGG